MTVPVVLVHGGAGNIDDGKRGEMIEGVKSAALRGYEVLKKGGTCLDAAQACVECMEANPVFNAGKFLPSHLNVKFIN